MAAEHSPEEIGADTAERGQAPRAACDLGRLSELVGWLEEEYGPITENERAAAVAELENLDAEHERRRTLGARRDRPAAKKPLSEPIVVRKR
ncbi:CopG family transcriptional regulator [Nonomuraea sp. PA05]|uniref:CopG family transcriptional regulator n=1 Tax=Nonomuraea sp. PA05 TaxID=2604466 RepID=UPI001CA3127D|nr:CopG family transcriptional regulator [Nonomuraea sp. PA05]